MIFPSVSKEKGAAQNTERSRVVLNASGTLKNRKTQLMEVLRKRHAGESLARLINADPEQINLPRTQCDQNWAPEMPAESSKNELWLE